MNPIAQEPAAVTRVDPAIDAIVPHDAAIEKLVSGLGFTEGPVWTRDSAVLFSDIPNNTIYRWEGGDLTVFRRPSGYDGAAPPGPFMGANGLTLDSGGCLVVCEHGNRRVTRIEPDGSATVLATHFEGKRLNSPNDAVHHSSGALYFTDPPYGLRKLEDDPARELAFNGVFRLHAGRLDLLHDAMTRPNGLAFSPDEKVLYVANSDVKRRLWMRFDVRADGSLSAGDVFFDATESPAEGLPDGMKVDRDGMLYCTGPGGICIFTPDARHLGTIHFPEQPANCHWGDDDARTLYVTARTSLYRIRIAVPGIRP